MNSNLNIYEFTSGTIRYVYYSHWMAQILIYEYSIIGGLSGVHQFVSIGKYSMIGGMSGVGSNIIPYGLYYGVRKILENRLGQNSLLYTFLFL